VGLTENEAAARGLDFRVATMPMASVSRAIEISETRGFMKALVDKGSDQILGCAMLGVDGGELMAMVQVAMMGSVTASRLADAVLTHPTLAESLNTLFAR
jgi:pyruvate/2-oxoglutarate dehydrogenase complex dihydrolipoamide dehydrogenase (E3) component